MRLFLAASNLSRTQCAGPATRCPCRDARAVRLPPPHSAKTSQP